MRPLLPLADDGAVEVFERRRIPCATWTFDVRLVACTHVQLNASECEMRLRFRHRDGGEQRIRRGEGPPFCRVVFAVRLPQ